MQQAERPALKPASYEYMVLDEEFGPVELTVDDHLVRTFAYAVDDMNPWYLHDSPFGGRITPSSALANPVLGLWTLRYDASTDHGIHAKQELKFYEPVKIGQKVVCRAWFTDKYFKRDKPYVVTEGEVLAAEDGRRLIWFRGSEMVGMQPGLQIGSGTASPDENSRASERILPHADPGLSEVSRARADAPVGSPLPTLTKRVTLKQMIAFSASETSWRNMHTDHEYATSVGLPAPIAQGLMTTAYLCELCTEFFGEAWYRSGEIGMSFLRPVYAEDVLLIKGAVSDRSETEGGTRLSLNVWCEDQKQLLVAVGRASAIVQ